MSKKTISKKIIALGFLIIMIISFGTFVACDDEYLYDKVIVVFTIEATREFLTYTPEDFSEIGCESIEDLTYSTVGWVAAHFGKEPPIGSGPFEEGQTILTNIEKFKRKLSLELIEKNKKNALKAVELLKQRVDIESAELARSQMTYYIFQRKRLFYDDIKK